MTERTPNKPLFDLAKLKKKGFQAGSLIAVDPQLFDKFMTHLGRTVKRDVPTKTLVFLTGLSAYTKNPINLFLRGESSTGKTYNTVQTLRYWPQADVWKLGGLTPKALIHGYGILVDDKDEEIDFREKPKKDAPDEEKKRWREKLQRARYIIDLQGKILVFLEAPHFDTYNMLRPILSHDAPEISYRFTDKTKTGSLRTTHVVIRGWPATVFCTTKERYVKDLSTRGFTISPETGPKKYRAAIDLVCERKAFPWKFGDQDMDFTLLQGFIGWLKQKFEGLNVVIPYVRELGKLYPAIYPRCMRDIDHFTALIEIMALFHCMQRPVLIRTYEREILTGPPVEEEEYTILANMKDFQRIVEIWRHAEETTVTGLPGYILDFFHKVVEPLEGLKVNYEQLTTKYNEISEERRSSDTIGRWVKLLKQVGWMDTEPDPLDKRRKLASSIKKTENSGYSRIQQLSSSFKLENFENWLEEVKKITAHKAFLLKENLLAEETSSPDTIYEKHFRAVNFSGSSKAELEPAEEKEAENSGIRQSPTIPKLLTFEQILSGPHGLTGEMFHKGRCAICGEEKTIEWHITDFNRERREICGDCAWKYSDYLQKRS